MRDFFAFIGVAALLGFGAVMIFGDNTPDVPLTPEEKARVEYEHKYKKDNKMYAYMKKRIPPDATDVKYIGYRWVTFYMFDQCMMAQASESSGYAYLGLSAVNSSVCEQAAHRIPEFTFDPYKSVGNGGVQY